MKTVAIVGMAQATRHLAPWDDPDIPIWVMNETGGSIGKEWLRRWDRTYQLHKPFDYRRPNNQNDADHWEWLKAQTKPIYMQEVDPEVPASVKFPKDEIVAKYLKNYQRINSEGPIEYFKSTAAYMLAHAGLEGFDRIEIYGVEMSFETEYRHQRPNFEFWMGLVGTHAEIVIPHDCGLLGGPRSDRYGYDQRPAMNPTQFNIRLMSMQKEREKFLQEAKKLQEDGMLAEKQAKAFSGDAKRAKALRKQVKERELQVEDLVAKINILTGHIDEAQFTISVLDQLSSTVQESAWES